MKVKYPKTLNSSTYLCKSPETLSIVGSQRTRLKLWINFTLFLSTSVLRDILLNERGENPLLRRKNITERFDIIVCLYSHKNSHCKKNYDGKVTGGSKQLSATKSRVEA